MSYTEEELIEELHRISEEFCNGNSPKIKIMQDNGKYSRWVYEDRFGSWNSALKRAGYNVNVQFEVAKEGLIEDYRRVAEEKSELDRATVEDIEKYGKYCKSTYFNHFDDWNEVLEAAGFQTVDGNRFGPSGNQHYRWKGGISFGDYGRSWSYQRRNCLKRDEYSCCVCEGKNASEHFERPDVHHITPVRFWEVQQEHKTMNHSRNLIALCRSCHLKLEGKFKGRNYEEFKQLAREFLDMDEEAIGQQPVSDNSVFDY